MKTLIIDDDPKSHKILKGLLSEEHTDVQVLASGYDLQEGIDLIVRHKPELIFLDIELQGDLGFDLLAQVSGHDLDFHVIFITAYDKYAITAIRFGALEFLVKPIIPKELAFALEKARGEKPKIREGQLQILLETYKNLPNRRLPSKIAISSQTDIDYITVKDIVRLEADKAYTKFYLSHTKQPLISSNNLGKYVDQFRPYGEFAQVHRSHLINLHYVKKYKKREQMIYLSDGSKVSLAKTFYDDFRNGMDNL